MTTNSSNEAMYKEVLPPSDTFLSQEALSECIKSSARAYFPEFCETIIEDAGCPLPCPCIEDAYLDVCRAVSELGNEDTQHAANMFAEPIKIDTSVVPCEKGELNSFINCNEINGLTYLSPFDVPNIYKKSLDAKAVRKDFPILSEKVNGQPLIWFDNAATTQKPRCVIDRLKYFYEHENSNVHRGAHTLSRRTTDAYEEARAKAAAFINAADAIEIVFVRGTTEAVNLVAHAYGLNHLSPGDEILVTHLEHHANIVPWQMIAAKTGAKLKVIPVDDGGDIRLDEYGNMLSNRTKIVALTHVCNAIGTITPAAQMTRMAHELGAKVLIDGAQAVAHFGVDVQELNCDFYAFSGHKVFGPTGIGVLYAKSDIFKDMPPYQGGGSMIEDVTFERATYKAPPHRFEAGTANIADAIALGSALDYVKSIGLHHITAYENKLRDDAVMSLKSVSGLRFIGKQRTGILSFIIDGFETEYIGKYLDSKGIAVRAGHHCAQPILRRLGVESTVRASLAFYNTRQEIDSFVSAMHGLTHSRPFISF